MFVRYARRGEARGGERVEALAWRHRPIHLEVFDGRIQRGQERRIGEHFPYGLDEIALVIVGHCRCSARAVIVLEDAAEQVPAPRCVVAQDAGCGGIAINKVLSSRYRQIGPIPRPYSDRAANLVGCRQTQRPLRIALFDGQTSGVHQAEAHARIDAVGAQGAIQMVVLTAERDTPQSVSHLQLIPADVIAAYAS